MTRSSGKKVEPPGLVIGEEVEGRRVVLDRVGRPGGERADATVIACAERLWGLVSCASVRECVLEQDRAFAGRC